MIKLAIIPIGNFVFFIVGYFKNEINNCCVNNR